MKLISLLIVLFSLMFSTLHAGEIQAQFNLLSESSQLKEGDLVEGVIKVWPIENADLNEFKTIATQTFFNTFQILEIQSLEVSANNADVVEVKILFAVKSAKDIAASAIKYKNQTIVVPAPVFKVIPLQGKNKDYFVLDQAFSYTHWFKYFLIIGGAAIALTIFLMRKKIKRLIKTIKADPIEIAMKKFSQKFSNAKSREDFEEIYLLKKEWLKLLKEQTPAYQEFFKTLNQHQYKKNWGPVELKEVQESFDVIRGSFK